MCGNIDVGLKFSGTALVSDDLTAKCVGSGGLAVLATPALVTLVEKICFDGLEPLLPAGQTTVGTKLDIAHIAASPVGAQIQCDAQLSEIDRRRLVFTVEAHEGDKKIASGSHERFIVDADKFMSRLDTGAAKPPVDHLRTS